MKGGIILLKIDQGFIDSDDLTLKEMEALYQEYGKTWWKDKRLDFDSSPLYKQHDPQPIRKVRW